MITHLLFKGLNSFNIGSGIFRKILAVIVSVLIFTLVFLAVNFTKVEVPNFNRNLIMLAIVDISAFGLVMWKFEPFNGNHNDEKIKSVVDETQKKVEENQEKENQEKDTTSNKTNETRETPEYYVEEEKSK